MHCTVGANNHLGYGLQSSTAGNTSTVDHKLLYPTSKKYKNFSDKVTQGNSYFKHPKETYKMVSLNSPETALNKLLIKNDLSNYIFVLCIRENRDHMVFELKNIDSILFSTSARPSSLYMRFGNWM